MTAPPFRVKAVYDYTSPHDEDLSFPNGQIIQVTDEEDADWYYGKYLDQSGAKKEGLFPKNFVERYEPTTPPRPSKSARPKKEAETPAVPEPSTEPSTAKVEDPQAAKEATIPPPESSDTKVAISPPPALAVKEEEPNISIIHKRGPSSSKIPQLADAPPSTASQKQPSKPITSTPAKPIPPETAEKPSGSSFRDRIAAFNKPAASPVAPMKPGGLGGSAFIKKPYVAPPPSRNAYVPLPREPPPQKIYRREEDPEVVSSNADTVNAAASISRQGDVDEAGEDQPKPTSLKERIALLQKQQMEQAARHVEAAQKKEKPKKPPKRHTDSQTTGGSMGDDGASGRQERAENNEDTKREQAAESSFDEDRPRARSSTRKSKSKEATPLASPTRFHNDPNDADQSGAGDTEDGGEVSTGKDDSDDQPRSRVPTAPQQAPHLPPSLKDEENEEEEEGGEEEDEEEEEEIDPEVQRRMEIRERMAKMSGGMGMAGMFGPPGGMPILGAKKQKASGSSAKQFSNDQGSESAEYSAPRQPLMALPGMQRVRSPEETEKQLEVAKEEEPPSTSSISQNRNPNEMPDIENVERRSSQKSRKSIDKPLPPPVPQDRPRAAPPPIPTERPVPTPPQPEVRPMPPSDTTVTPSSGSESDDELSYPERTAPDTDEASDVQPTTRSVPQIPRGISVMPPRPQPPRTSSQTETEQQDRSPDSAHPITPTATNTARDRSSRIPPIPGSSPAIASAPQMRAPPPPLPTQPPPSRPINDDIAHDSPEEESDEEVTEYDGDYDTDMASSVTHKDALKSHNRQSSTDEVTTGDEDSYHHEGLPSLGPPPGPPPLPSVPAPRAVPPPPPPTNPPKHVRQPSDMPRAAPPPPPPPRTTSHDEASGEYDPYSYLAPKQAISPTSTSRNPEDLVIPKITQHDDYLYDASPPTQYPPSPSIPGPASYNALPSTSTAMPRQSLDVHRSGTNRRSIEVIRPSMEQGFIATDVDPGRGSQWWCQRSMPPPVFQNRSDITFEIEETNATNHVIKRVYVLYMDYSQTILSARFDPKDPSKAEFQQRHEPPPLGLRQDQLEDAHTKFGARIAEAAQAKLNSVLGDGSPFALVVELIHAIPGALPPVGTRAYGALVYTNLANATVQQNDEIRAGDIVSFRNTKLQGHKGPMKQKYNIEVGKPDHVGIVVDWDGTKKKIRAWEQGRESKKVKIESYKLSDLKSGEVKVWRAMAREWVGWGRGHS